MMGVFLAPTFHAAKDVVAVSHSCEWFKIRYCLYHCYRYKRLDKNKEIEEGDIKSQSD